MRKSYLCMSSLAVTWLQLSGIDTPEFVPDRAITDPDPVRLVERLPKLVGETAGQAVLENLPLTNNETLLVNTAGSWASRPTAT